MAWTRSDLAAMFQRMVSERYGALAENVKRERKARGWGHPELSKASGVSIGTLSRIENGRHEARNHTVRQLAKAFEMSFTDLLPPLELSAEEEDRFERIEAKLDETIRAQAEVQAALDELLKTNGRQRTKRATGKAAARSRQRRAKPPGDRDDRQAGGQAS